MRSAVILSGGQSVRMGTDKGRLELEGRSLFHWVFSAISQVVDEIVISVSSKEQSEHIALERIGTLIAFDESPGQGPIGGLLSGLKKCRGEYVAVAPVDAPLIKPGLYELLFKRIVGHEGAVPKIRGYWEPLVAVYKRDAMLSAIERTVARNSLDIRSAYPHLDIVEVHQQEIGGIDPDLLSFANINTVEDLEKLKFLLNEL